jgi:twitching motility protein PilT
MAFELETLLEFCVKAGASDMHLQEGKPPVYRVNGNLIWQQSVPPLENRDMVRFLDKLLTDDTRRKAFAQKGSADIGYSVPGSGRFRLNVFRQLSGISMVARHIPTKIPDFNGLNLPPRCARSATNGAGWCW